MRTPRPARLPVLVSAIVVTVSLASPVAFAAPAGAERSALAGPAPRERPEDFNGDGYRDLAVSAPGTPIAGRQDSGSVAVLYGSRSGALQGRRQILHQDVAGIRGTVEANDMFGGALTTADLDRDGYTDLVIGTPYENIGTAGKAGFLKDAGSLTVVWGGPRGLNGSTVLDGVVAYGELGRHLTAGDVDGDGDQDIVTSSAAGRDIAVFEGPIRHNGATAGITAFPHPEHTRNLDLASGDVNGDGMTDIVVARKHYDLGDRRDHRYVMFWPGGPAGLATPTELTDAEGLPLEADHVAVGRIDGDRYADVVAGRSTHHVNRPDEPAAARGGMITYLPGSAAGPVPARSRVLNQDSPGIPGTAGESDLFGSGLSIGDTDRDGYGDISVGVPNKRSKGAESEGGRVVVVRGGAYGPSGTGAKAFSQNTPGVPGTGEKSDLFGRTTRLADTDGDGRAELFIGNDQEHVGKDRYAGALWRLPSTASGTTARGAHMITPRDLGMPTPWSMFAMAFQD
ncbi:FG-GAP-like repeat-containing protein [Streptomyces sp. NPDC000594]|uniref:FG-GAP-like repeat-containing protein n=1 Tax=Streptomyces sp. NPDC000594 TaxID=3154261 RepID=UPI003320CA05